MTLLDEAREKAIIICPYYKLSKWYKLKTKLEILKSKQIKAEFYVQSGEVESISEIKSLGYTPYEIHNLHCKIYMNESTAIISSMNLLLSSELNSLDIAYKTETKDEYLEIYTFYQKYINNAWIDKENLIRNTTIDHNRREILLLKEALEKRYNKIKEINYHEKSMIVVTNFGSYRAYISNHYLEMIALVSPSELQFAKNNAKDFFFDKDTFISYVDEGNMGCPKLFGRYEKILSTKHIDSMDKHEVVNVLNAVLNFVDSTENVRDLLDSIRNEDILENRGQ